MCSSASGAGGRVVSGFTLIEMVVVMVLLGLITSLTLPAMQRWHDAVQARAQVTQVVEALRSAGFAAGARWRELRMDEQSFHAAPLPPAAAAAASAAGTAERVLVTLPPGWTVQRVVPATFLSSGLCRPGMAALTTDRHQALVVRVDGPVCAVEVLPAVQGGRS